jgi:peptidoglycan/LPS O-acetylase OafA/YrhL
LRYRADIDGLRAIAVGSVVLFHAGVPGIAGGFVGVDIFFVISGFLITKIIRDSIQEDRFSLADFYDRRIRRIFPALFTVYFVTYVLGLILLMPGDLKALGKSLLSSAAFVANFHFYENVGYFDAPSITKPLLHTWSLSVEEQFYVLWPLAMIALARFVKPRYWLPIVLCSLILSLAYAEWEIWRDNASAAFYLPHARAWELMMGALLAIALPRLAFGRRLCEGMVALGLVLIAGSIALLSEDRDFPGLNAVVPCLGAALIIAAGARGPTAVGRLLSNKPVVFLGLISYSLYLWHWPLFSFWHLGMDRAPGTGETFGLIGASVLLATLSWRYIETPFRRRGAHAKPRITMRAGIAAISAAAVCGLIVSSLEGLPQRFDANVAVIFDTANQNPGATCVYEGARAKIKPECLLGRGQPNGPFDVGLIGDSHARHFSPAIDSVLDAYDASGRFFSVGGCLALFGVKVYIGGRLRKKCTGYFDGLTEFFANDNNSKLVIIAARWQAYSDANRTELKRKDPARLVDDIDTQPGDVAATRRVLERALRRTVETLTQKGKRVLLLGQVPPYPTAPTSCVARARYSGQDERRCFASAKVIAQYLDYSNTLLRTIASEFDSVEAFLPTDVLCDEKSCSVFLNDVFLYRDNDHLNRLGSRQFADYLSTLHAFSVVRPTGRETAASLSH